SSDLSSKTVMCMYFCYEAICSFIFILKKKRPVHTVPPFLNRKRVRGYRLQVLSSCFYSFIQALSFGMLFFDSSTVPSVYCNLGRNDLSNTFSSVIIHFSISSREGISNIISSIILSRIVLNPRAPVFLSIASCAIAQEA